MGPIPDRLKNGDWVELISWPGRRCRGRIVSEPREERRLGTGELETVVDVEVPSRRSRLPTWLRQLKPEVRHAVMRGRLETVRIDHLRKF